METTSFADLMKLGPEHREAAYRRGYRDGYRACLEDFYSMSSSNSRSDTYDTLDKFTESVLFDWMKAAAGQPDPKEEWPPQPVTPGPKHETQLIKVTLDGVEYDGFEKQGVQFAITEHGIISPYLAKDMQRNDEGDWHSAHPNEEEITYAMDWIQKHAKPRKTINRAVSSYGLKHLAEESAPTGYISNGAFIMAALRLGYHIQPYRSSPNAYFNMTAR